MWRLVQPRTIAARQVLAEAGGCNILYGRGLGSKTLLCKGCWEWQGLQGCVIWTFGPNEPCHLMRARSNRDNYGRVMRVMAPQGVVSYSMATRSNH